MRFVDPFLGNSIYHIYVYEVSATKNIGQPVSSANFNLIFSKKLVLSDFFAVNVATGTQAHERLTLQGGPVC